MFARKPKPKYQPGDLVVMDDAGRDRIMQIHAREFVKGVRSQLPGGKSHQDKYWAYSGVLLDMAVTKNPNIPMAPKYRTSGSHIVESRIRGLLSDLEFV